MDPLAAPAGAAAATTAASASAAGGAASLPEALAAKLGVKVDAGIGIPAFEIAADKLYAALETLKRDPELAFDQLTYLTATDETPETPRFRLVYFLLSVRTGRRVRVVTRVPESESPVVRSVVPLWIGANWLEREVFDMFGVRFDGHPDLRRILMPEGYGHFPLRKEFPIEGIQPDRLYREWERASR